MPNLPGLSLKSSPTNTLLLNLRSSRCERRLRWLLRLALAAAVAALAADGYPAAAAAILLGAVLASRVRAPLVTGLYFSGGQWQVRLADRRWHALTELTTRFCRPACIALRWRRSGERGAHHLFVWPDSEGAGRLRQLRQRLQLGPAAGGQAGAGLSGTRMVSRASGRVSG